MAKITLLSGAVKNGEAMSLKVVVPSGISGKQLRAWKIANNTTICNALESGDIPQSFDISGDEPDTSEGDSFGRI